MQEIRDTFQKELDELLLLAKGFIALINFGKFYLEQFDPNTEFSVHVRHESPLLPSVTSELVNFGDILNIYGHNQNAIEEMIHTQSVQKWHDFLGKVYEQILIEQLGGKKSYAALNNVSIKKIDLSTAEANNIITKVQESALSSFNFEPADKRLDTIITALERKKTIPNELKKAIQKHITVRNVFQHNNGVLRTDDIKKWDKGATEITLLDKDAIPEQKKAGDALIITYWELEAVKQDFYQAASLLIP